MNAFDEWFARKLARRRLSIREPREVSHVFKRALGGRGQYAGLTVRFEPADDFSLDFRVQWPENEVAELYEHCVMDGVLDELLTQEIGFVVTRLRVHVLAIEWHPVDSAPIAFYFAARGAVRRGLGLDDWHGYNVDLEISAG
ncbi:MAG: hypothetical protein ACYC3X_30495 [Pirellulaceae bacterium]